MKKEFCYVISIITKNISELRDKISNYLPDNSKYDDINRNITSLSKNIYNVYNFAKYNNLSFTLEDYSDKDLITVYINEKKFYDDRFDLDKNFPDYKIDQRIKSLFPKSITIYKLFYPNVYKVVYSYIKSKFTKSKLVNIISIDFNFSDNIINDVVVFYSYYKIENENKQDNKIYYDTIFLTMDKIRHPELAIFGVENNTDLNFDIPFEKKYYLNNNDYESESDFENKTYPLDIKDLFSKIENELKTNYNPTLDDYITKLKNKLKSYCIGFEIKDYSIDELKKLTLIDESHNLFTILCRKNVKYLLTKIYEIENIFIDNIEYDIETDTVFVEFNIIIDGVLENETHIFDDLNYILHPETYK